MFGKKKMQKEIDDLQSRLRVIETFTVPYASETKRALYLMNVPSSGRGDVVTRLSSLETSVRELSSVRLTTYEEHNKLWHLVNNLAELLGYKRNTHTSDSVCPDVWIGQATDTSQPMETVLEPTGRLRQRKGK